MSRIVEIEGYQFWETEKGIKFGLYEDEPKEAVWLAKSTTDVHPKTTLVNNAGLVTLTLPEFIAIEKGLL